MCMYVGCARAWYVQKMVRRGVYTRRAVLPRYTQSHRRAGGRLVGLAGQDIGAVGAFSGMFRQDNRCASWLRCTASHLHATARCPCLPRQQQVASPPCTIGSASTQSTLSETTLNYVEADVSAQTEILYDET